MFHLFGILFLILLPIQTNEKKYLNKKILDNDNKIKYIFAMKYSALKYSLFLFIATVAIASAFLDYFRVTPDNGDVIVEWKTSEEVNLKVFVIERKNQNSPFTDIATVNPTGSNSTYSYRDENAYKTNDLNFTYRLRIVDLDGRVTYSQEAHVSLSVSSVKRTWGSIKALFR